MPDFLGKVWIQPAAVPDLRRRRFLLIGDFPEKFTSPSQHRSVSNAAQLARGNRPAPPKFLEKRFFWFFRGNPILKATSTRSTRRFHR